MKKLDNYSNCLAILADARDSFIPAFKILKETLIKKLDETESDWT